MPANHTPDIGCYLPSEEEIERLKAEFRAMHLAKKRKEQTSTIKREPSVVSTHSSGRVIRKAVN